jgi:AcrR family transcriptional regulator
MEALVAAARTLIARGLTPTVEDAAAEADISRTTAYRYFPNRRELLIAAYPEIGERSFLPDDPPDDPHERLDLVLDKHLTLTVENEPALRTAFLLSLDPDTDRRELVLRGGRGIGWFEDALGPLRGRLSPKAISRLARAIRATAGIEAMIWLCDVGGLSRPEAVKLMKWSAHALVDAAIDDAAEA